MFSIQLIHGVCTRAPSGGVAALILSTVLAAHFLSSLDAEARQVGKDHPRRDEIQRLLTVTDSLRKEGKVDEAYAMLDPELLAAESQPDSFVWGTVLIHKGRLLYRTGNPKEAIDFYEHGIAIGRGIDDSYLVCEGLMRKGNALDALGRDPRAIPVYEELQAAAQAYQDTLYVAQAHLYLGRRIQRNGEFDEARRRFELARDGFAAVNAKDDELSAVYLLGLNRAMRGDSDGARENWEQAAAMATDTGNDMMRANCMNNLGKLEFNGGDPAVAAEYFREASDSLTRLGRVRAAILPTQNAGHILVILGRYDEAEAAFEEMRATCAERGFTDLEAQSWANLGSVANARHDYGEAARMYREALARLPKNTDLGSEVSYYHGLAQAMAHRDSTAHALALLESNTAPLKPKLEVERQLHVDREIAGYLVELERNEEALPLLKNIEAVGMESNQRQEALNALYLAGRAYLALGVRDSSLACLTRAADLWESQRQVPSDPEWRERRGTNGAAIFTAMAQAYLGDPGAEPPQTVREVFDVLQRYKARTLLERMMAPGSDVVAIEGAPAPVSLAQVQTEVLRPGELLLDVYVGPHYSFVFAVNADECRVLRMPGTKEGQLESRLTLYHELLGNPSGDISPGGTLATTSQHLGTLLIGDADDMIASSQRLVYAPDGVLNLVPLASLQLGADGELLLQREVRRIPSATVLAWQRGHIRERDRALRPLLAYAGGTDARGTVLAGARAEAQRLYERFDGVDLCVGDEPSGIQFETAELANYDALHLAAHAAVYDQDPWRSAILLGYAIPPPDTEGEDGTGDSEGAAARVEEARRAVTSTEGQVLRASDIANMELGARLAVLSACESGGGRVLSGEGVQGLSSAFLSAGVPAVIATLWPVDDQATAQLMEEFYGELAAGESAGPALQAAQRSLRSRAETAHPFYWAGFVLVGDGDVGLDLHPKRGSRNIVPGLTIAGLVVLMLALGTRARRRRA